MDKLDYIFKTETVPESLVDRCPRCMTLFKRGKPILPFPVCKCGATTADITPHNVRLLVDIPEDELKEIYSKHNDKL